MIEVNKLTVLNDNVLCVGIKPESRGGIVKGVTTDDKPEIGRVLKVGPGRLLENGERADTGINPGMLILFNQHVTTKFNFEGSNYFVLRAEDVIAVQ